MRALGFRTFAWVATAGVAMAVSYMISHQVSSERTELESVNAKIAVAHRDIRNLKTELGTRASMRQLEQWNVDVMGLATPDANQFLNSDQMLAALNKHGIRRGTEEGAPVMVAAASVADDVAAGGDAPAPRAVSDVNIASEVIERRVTRQKMLTESSGDAARIALKPGNSDRSGAVASTVQPTHQQRVDNLAAGVFGARASAKTDVKGAAASKPAATKPAPTKTSSSTSASIGATKKPTTAAKPATSSGSKPKAAPAKPSVSGPAKKPSGKAGQ